MTHPYMPLYVDDYEAATTHLTAEEDGVYSRLMRLCWRTPGCAIPNDPAWIARKIRLSAADYERVAKPVIDEFFKVQRGRLIQKRLKEEYDTISRKKTARVKAGKMGGDAKARKSKEIDASNASDLPAHTGAFPEPEPEPEDKGAVVERASDDDWPEGKAIDHAALLVLEAATVFLDPSRQMLLVTTTGRLDAWRRAGASWEHDVVPVVTALARKARSPIASWKFFDTAIAQSIADNAAALEIPAASPRNDPQRPDRNTAQLGHIHRVFAAMGSVDDGPVERGREDRGYPGDEGRLRSLPPAA